MTRTQLRIIKRAIIIRLADGETFQEAVGHYPRLTPSEIADLEQELRDEGYLGTGE